MSVVIIGQEDVGKLLTMKECIEIMSKTLEALADGNSLQPLRSMMKLPSQKGLLGMMPAYSADRDVMGIKVVSAFAENYKIGLSSHQGVILLFDGGNGRLLAMVDADSITAERTAAVSAVATRALAREDASDLAILGTGVQAEAHLRSIRLVRDIGNVRVWDIDSRRAENFAKQEAEVHGLSIRVEDSAREAVDRADIICTLTPAREPILESDWVRPGAHINAVGACFPAARELDSALVARSRLFADSRESLFNESGDFLIPLREGKFDESHFLGELGEVLTGHLQGRTNDEEITLFKSLGLAVEDVSAGYYVYEEAKKRNLGIEVAI